jgi:hypothetical protein
VKTIGLLVLLAAACSGNKSGPTNKPPDTKPPGTIDTCKVDTDCALVDEGCCGCNAGGKKVAIAASASTLYDQEHKQSCGGTMCPAVMSNDPSCHADAACEAGKCVAKPRAAGSGDAPPPM